MAAAVSPSLRATRPVASRPGAGSAQIFASLSVAFGPASHWIASASRALRACHHESATTATPREVSTTARTPGMPRAFSSLNVLTEPPSTGGCASAAYSMPGSFTSMP